MLMKRLFAITIAVAALAALTFAGCSKDEDTITTQQTTIVRYLTSTHSPKLLSEEDAAVSLDSEPPYYTTAGETAYRYIADSYNSDRLSQPVVEWGDALTITFRAYQFSGSNISASVMPFYSNDPALEEAYSQAGLTPTYWSFEPLRIVLGETEILKGLEVSLAGCRELDVVEVYMTYNMAYGDENIGIIPKETAIAFYFTVDSVEKREE